MFNFWLYGVVFKVAPCTLLTVLSSLLIRTMRLRADRRRTSLGMVSRRRKSASSAASSDACDRRTTLLLVVVVTQCYLSSDTSEHTRLNPSQTGRYTRRDRRLSCRVLSNKYIFSHLATNPQPSHDAVVDRHTVLPVTRHKWTPPPIYLSRGDGRLSCD